MAFTTGTATDYHDLLDKFRLWITGTVGWTQLNWVAPTTLATPALLQLSGPGAGADKRVYVNIRSESDVAATMFGWRMRAAVGYTAGATEGTNAGESPAVYFNLWSQSTTYWFYANARRFVIVAKTSTTYVSCYGGFFLPWGTPAQYPFPLFIGGDYPSLQNWSFTNSGRRFFVEPGSDLAVSGAWVREPNGAWIPVAASDFGTENNNPFPQSQAPHAVVLPWHTGGSYSLSSPGSNWNGGAGGFSTGGMLDILQPTAQGERVVRPAELIQVASPTALGVLDGVYAPFGNGLSTEQVLTANGMTLRAFQNIQRSSGNDFLLVEEI